MKLENRKTYQRTIGVDVASQKLDLNDSSGKLPTQIVNESSEILKHLVRNIKAPKETLVICESTGCYHEELVEAMHDAGIAVVVANPRQVRDFAKGHGFLEKNDKLDAAIIRKFGEDVFVRPLKPPTPEQRYHRAIHRRREQLNTMLQQERNRFSSCGIPSIQAMIQKSIDSIKTEIKSLNKEIAGILKELAKTDPRIERWSSVPGVGQVTVSAMVCEVPEIGELSRGGIAKLMGLAPLINQSGQSDKKRPVRGGRSSVRSTLYMAALSATQHNEHLKVFYKRLVGKGKPNKSALIAVARKLLLILNQMARPEGQCWKANGMGTPAPINLQPAHEKSSRVPSLN
jgi:transposase